MNKKIPEKNTTFLIVSFCLFVLFAGFYSVIADPGDPCANSWEDCTMVSDTDTDGFHFTGDNPQDPGICTETYYDCIITMDTSYCGGTPIGSNQRQDECSGDTLTEYYEGAHACSSTAYDCGIDGGEAGTDRCDPNADCPTSNCNYDDWSCKTNSWGGYCGVDDRDLDTSSAYCNDCNARGQPVYWNIGGEVDRSTCCGDESGQYRNTRSCASWCSSDSGDDACCNAQNKCVYNSNCYSTQTCYSDDAYCNAGTWYDSDYNSNYCDTCAGGGRWSLGGEASPYECCGDEDWEHVITEHSSTDAPAGYNSGDTACCDAGNKCADDDTCTASGSARGSIPSRAWCSATYWYGGDASTAACSAITGGANNWNLGGEVAATACCGDDSSEYRRTCSVSGNTPESFSCSGDTEVCCNTSSDCVDDGGCYADGYCRNDAVCVNGAWQDQDNGDVRCAQCQGSGHWYLEGDASSWPNDLCCEDDSNEYIETCSDMSPQGDCGSDTTACCDAYDDCVDQNGDCRTIGECYGSGVFGNSYCGAVTASASGWYDPDISQSRCKASCDITPGDGGIGYNLGGEIDATTCCGDDAGEYYTIEKGATDAPADYKNGITACCGSGKCSYNYECIASGQTSSPAIPNRAYCSSGTWEGGDDSQTACNAIVGAGRWSIGGIANCCGDDSGEYVRSRACDGYACTTSAADDACCDQTTDCVYSSVCYNSGDALPGVSGATCVSGTWRDTTAPVTSIAPNGGDYTGYNTTQFTLTCADTGGSGCDKTYYKIISSTDSCGTTGYTVKNAGSVQDSVTCPFGQTCDLKVCYYSNDNANNVESVKQSNAFHLETNACQGKQCGEACWYVTGICDANNGNCYPSGGCLLTCVTPSPGANAERVWVNSNCGRTGAYKCAASSICSASLTSCTLGGASTQVTGDWSSYVYPAGSYGVGYTMAISLSGVTRSPSGFTILSECKIVEPNGYSLYFNNWGMDVTYSYVFKANDPEGLWSVDYCGLWSDFVPAPGSGWNLKFDNTDRQFYLDKSGPAITINHPKQGDIYNLDFPVSATVTDTYSAVGNVYYRWENSSSTGAWVQMAKSGNDYTANFDVDLVSDGIYSVRVNASDAVGNVGQAVVTNVMVDRQPPNITTFTPVPGWYRTNFEVKARVTDNQGLSMVRYHWENATNNGTWISMTLDAYSNYTATFIVTSVSSGNYTFRIWANDTMGNIAQQTVLRVGIDHISPSSQMTQPAKGSFVMSKLFNIAWTGSDAHSGVRCYYVTFWYCDKTSGICAEDQYNVTFPDGKCTKLNTFGFDTAVQTWWVNDPNNYTYFFKAIALDNAGNYEVKSNWETNVTIYIPKLVTFYVTENSTKAQVRNGGKVANNRKVIISVNAKEGITENLNITVYYSNHTLGKTSSWLSISCMNTRSCNASITINVTEAQNIMEVDYYIFAENASTKEFLPPNAPAGYFYYLVYYHPLCNFLAFDEFRMVLGSIELVAIEIRNIQNAYDNITLQLLSSFGKFVETSSPTQSIVLNPMEEKTIYARIISQASDFDLMLVGSSQSDLWLTDQDTIRVMVGFPPNFSELSDAAAMVLVLLAGLIYFGFVRTRP
jgi:hypothetical protein